MNKLATSGYNLGMWDYSWGMLGYMLERWGCIEVSLGYTEGLKESIWES